MDAGNKIGTPSNRLSDELIHNVLRYCTPKAILRFARTCRRYFHLVESSSRLQLCIELCANGLEILGSLREDNAVSSSVLENLTHHRNNWLDLEFGLSARTLSQELSTPWSLHDGIFASAIAVPVPEEDWPMRIWTICASLLFMSPSSLTTARHVDFQTLFTDYCFDLAQELAVLIDMSNDWPEDGGYELPRIFLRSTNDGLPHPYALQPKLTPDFGLNEQESARFRFSTTSIMDNVLLVKFTNLLPGFNPHTSEIWIWDWASGTVLGRIIRHKSYCQICFLDAQHLLIFEATRTEISLVIYTIPALHSDSRQPEVVAAESYLMLSPALTFQFPALHNSQKLYDGRCLLESGGTRSCVLRAGSTTLARLRVSTIALRLRLAQREHCLCGEHGDGSMEFRIFISVSKLLDIMGHHTKLGTTTLPWKDWGESSTRWFTSDIPPRNISRRSSSRMPHVSGSRYLITIPVPWPEQEDASTSDNEASGWSRVSYFLSVLDFHTPTVNRFANRVTDAYFNLQQPATEGEGTVSEFAMKEVGCVPEATLAEWLASDECSGQRKQIYAKTVGYDTPTVIRDGFAEPVVSRLPYRAVTRLCPVPGYEYWLMEGNNIIGSNSRGFNTGSLYTIGPTGAPQEVSNVEPEVGSATL